MLAIEWSQRIEAAWNDGASFGVGGVSAARDRCWPVVHNQVASESSADAGTAED